MLAPSSLVRMAPTAKGRSGHSPQDPGVVGGGKGLLRHFAQTSQRARVQGAQAEATVAAAPSAPSAKVQKTHSAADVSEAKAVGGASEDGDKGVDLRVGECDAPPNMHSMQPRFGDDDLLATSPKSRASMGPEVADILENVFHGRSPSTGASSHETHQALQFDRCGLDDIQAWHAAFDGCSLDLVSDCSDEKSEGTRHDENEAVDAAACNVGLPDLHADTPTQRGLELAEVTQDHLGVV